MKFTLIRLILPAVLVLLPSLAQACPVCNSAGGQRALVRQDFRWGMLSGLGTFQFG